jgi:hypothetical protein
MMPSRVPAANLVEEQQTRVQQAYAQHSQRCQVVLGADGVDDAVQGACKSIEYRNTLHTGLQVQVPEIVLSISVLDPETATFLRRPMDA